MPQAMPTYTYTQAADIAYNRVLALWNSSGGFAGKNDAFWLTGNTLRTVIFYMLAAGLTDAEKSFIVNALKTFVGTVPLDADNKTLENLSKGDIWLDDFGWWAIAFLLAAWNNDALGLDATTRSQLITSAEHCWKIMSLGWDTITPIVEPNSPVVGGVWNTKKNLPLSGRNCVTNEVFGLASQRLAAILNDLSYLTPDARTFFAEAKAKDVLFVSESATPPVYLVRERFDEVNRGFGVPGWFWAGDQGLSVALYQRTEDMDSIGMEVLKTMTDSAGVLHDRVSPLPEFERDYATGKGVLLDHFSFLIDVQYPPTWQPQALQFMETNAKAVWNSRIQADGQLLNQFLFNWNPYGTGPSYGGEPKDDLLDDPADQLVLQVAGLSALILGMRLAPNTIIPPS